MSSTSAISVSGLSKVYQLHHETGTRRRNSGAATAPTLSERLQQTVTAPWRRFVNGEKRTEKSSFHALKDINFEIGHGEVVGIIGRNGAGKSTLLKVLSRITEPTTGEIRLRGRVASLLEVGTGFHPELTGRENIFLNGAILGMSKAEIRSRFDEIVDFAEVEKFLDTAVKHYSSGMYVRLAFSVAAHLEPEILIVDEVLAVGDMGFQKKCLAKMETSSQQGRTIILVSHNMPVVLSLCKRAIYLDHGNVFDDGPVPRVIEKYRQAFTQSREKAASKNTACRLLSVQLADGADASQLPIDQAFAVEMTYEVLASDDRRYVPYLDFFTDDGACAFVANPVVVEKAGPGLFKATCEIPARFLNSRPYDLTVAVFAHTAHHYEVCFAEQMALSLNVIELPGDPVRHSYAGEIPGAVRPALDWRIAAESPNP